MFKKVIIFSLIVVVITVSGVFGMLYFKSIDPYRTIGAFSRNEINIVVDDAAIKTTSYPIINEDRILIPVDIIKNHIYEDIEVKSKYDRMYVSFENLQFKLESDKLDDRIKDGIKLNFLTEEIWGVDYVNIKGMEKLFSISLRYEEDSNILIIDKLKDTVRIGKVNSEARLRPKKSSFSFSMDKLAVGEEVNVYEEDEKWVRVRTKEGYIGYLLKKKLDIVEVQRDIDTQLNIVREDWKPEGKINLVWNHIIKYSPDLSEEEAIDGLDVISPTWFSVINSAGYVINNSDIEYVKDAHEKGYKVWALINNSFDKDLTKGLLASEEAQENVINQLLVYSSLYNLDGINIDFENVYYEDKDRLTSFVDKLTEALKEQNLIVSIDITVPSSSPTWSKFYDREKLGQIVDYCAVMTYDEHWASSPESGSVASINWVERGIERTLEYIPKEKLLMGIPFYTREWEETMTEDGKIKVKSKALSMSSVKERIEEHEAEVVWLDDTGQHYTEYMKEGKRYRIWIEDSKSIALKAQLVHQYDLVGAASWRKGFEDEDVWTVLNEVLKEKEEVVKR